MSIAFPYRLAPDGTTAVAYGPEHIEQMLDQLLFTSPGERVDRPDFGCGLLELVFEPASVALTAGLTAVITAAVQQWLGDVIDLASVDVTTTDSTLAVTVAYSVRATGQPAVAILTAPRRR